MVNKTEAVKVTLRPTQINKVKRIAKRDYDNTFSLTLRVMIDKFEEPSMTREEAKEMFGYTECAEEINTAIDAIYDSFKG